MSPYATPYSPYHHPGYPPMGGGRLLLQSPVVFPPPRLGHPPYFKARPWWGPPHPPNIYPPHGPPVAMNHGPPHNSHTYGPHHQPAEPTSSAASGPSASGGSQNFSSSNPSPHSYSAMRNNMRTNPPPMSYSAKRMQAHAQSPAKGSGESQSPPKPTAAPTKQEGGGKEEGKEEDTKSGNDPASA